MQNRLEIKIDWKRSYISLRLVEWLCISLVEHLDIHIVTIYTRRKYSMIKILENKEFHFNIMLIFQTILQKIHNSLGCALM